MNDRGRGQVYQPLSLARLGVLLAGADESRRWRLIAEFLEEYRWEPLDTRWGPATCHRAPPRARDLAVRDYFDLVRFEMELENLLRARVRGVRRSTWGACTRAPSVGQRHGVSESDELLGFALEALDEIDAIVGMAVPNSRRASTGRERWRSSG